MRLARRLLWLLLIGAVLVGGWGFASHNPSPVQIDLYWTQLPETPLWATLVAAFALGAAVAGLLCLYEMARLGLLARRYRKSVARLESEIHQLRNLPLATEASESGEAPAAVPSAVGAAGRDG